MVDATTLIAVGVAFWVIAASPGPANISNAAIAMRYGRRASVIYGLGLSVALVFWGVLAATGMGAVLQASAWLLVVLKLLGGGYLLWLAWQSGRSALRTRDTAVAEIGAGRWFWRGVILNLSNPKSVIAWMAALSMGLNPSDTVVSVLVTTLVCVAVAFLNNLSYSLLFSMGGMMALYRRGRRWIEGATAALFATGGLALIRSAVSR
ncbi:MULTISPECIES: LysE family translocator [unclassified Roseovarius]|uniref:LysE family translocator n=1 Tax=unclassified Roseovarius TaxID=2614913 RepID=UPI00273FB39E|nr:MULTISPECIES: LysE family translocator [unclassified Roseovarius]